MFVTGQPLQAPDHLHAGRGVRARTKPGGVHVRGGGEHLSDEAARLPSHCRVTADTRPLRSESTQGQCKMALLLFRLVHKESQLYAPIN